MTLTLEIPPRVFEGIERAAKERGVPVAEFALSVLEQFAAPEHDEATRVAAAEAGFGMFAGRGQSVDDFLAERHAEGEADYLAGLERQKAPDQAT
jgi:hypothetical protein